MYKLDFNDLPRFPQKIDVDTLRLQTGANLKSRNKAGTLL